MKLIFLLIIILLIILFIKLYKKENFTNTINLGLWCEYPEYKNMSVDNYFTTLLNFIKSKNINKIVFRVMNPCVFTMYDLTDGIFFKYMKQLPSNVKLWMLPYIANDGHWTSDWNLGCCSCKNGCCTTPEQLKELDCNCACDFKKVMYWISEANKQISIEGVVYEPEDSCLIGNTNTKLSTALQLLKQEQNNYSNLSNLKFGWTGAWTAVPNNGWDETFPQWYNLTRKTQNNILVDAYSGWSSTMLPPSPEFPNTIYGSCLNNTQYQKNSPQNVLENMLQIAPVKSSYNNNNYNAMFSVESGPENLKLQTKQSNCWYNAKTAKTITGLTYDNMYKKNPLGTINAFGAFNWTYEDFMEFIKLFSDKYSVNNFMIFQFNYIPNTWK